MDRTFSQDYEGTGGQGTGQQGNSGSAETPHASASASEYAGTHPIQSAALPDRLPLGKQRSQVHLGDGVNAQTD